jgi:2-dehydro-3-deoxyphosphogluconate aldolase/(4S)-4-hydroxy-2-oxoglutarate aldolase
MSKTERVQRLLRARIVAIMRGLPPQQAGSTVEALIAGGVVALEVTLNSDGALDQIRAACQAAGDRALVGAGTVLDAPAAVSAILAGAQFLVAPNVNEEVIRVGNRYGCPVIPGAMTPTEIVRALECGADVVKVFPAGTLGPRYFKEVKAPLKQALLMATGGISLESGREFLASGADMLGIGGSLVSNALVEGGRYAELTERARQFVALSNAKQ